MASSRSELSSAKNAGAVLKGTNSRMKAALFLVALALTACSAPGSSLGTLPSSSESSSAARKPNDILGGAPAAKLRVMLFDAPIAGLPSASVNIGIDGLQLITATANVVPFVTNSSPQVVNLLDLQNYSANFDGTAPAGAYSAVRMLVDTSASNVKVGSTTIPIVWGSGSNTRSTPVSVAIDFPVAFVLDGMSGEFPRISMDFNVLHSVKYSNGVIYVTPSVSAASAAAQIAGKVQNRSGKPVSSAAILVVDTLGKIVNSTVTANDGSYKIHALPGGTYSIQVKNTYVTAVGDTITAVGADAGAAPAVLQVLAPNDNVHLATLID